MPNRIIREGINDSLRINALSQLCELFYRRLQLLVDDFGRYEAEPALLRAKLYGLRPEVTVADVCEHLRALASGDNPLIVIYTVKNKKYLEIKDFGQRTRTERYPPPTFASNCEHLHARASDTHTPPTTNSPTEEESARETKPLGQLDEGWMQFEALCDEIGLVASDTERQDLSALTWPRLGFERQLLAVDCLKRRRDSGEYSPGFAPTMDNYLRKQLWTRTDRPRGQPEKKPPRGNAFKQALGEMGK